MHVRGSIRLLVCGGMFLAAAATAGQPATARATSDKPAAQQATGDKPAAVAALPGGEPLRPTAHQALPENLEDYWFAPRPAERAAARSSSLAEAASAYAAGNFAAAATYSRQAVAAGGPLADYARV
jgi:hypothetical protein